MEEQADYHDSSEKGDPLEIEKKVYYFQGKKTTRTKTLDKWLREEFSEVPEGAMGGIPYDKIKGVDIVKKKFKEVTPNGD